MAQNQLITTRTGVYKFPSLSAFPTVGYNRFIYVDQSNGTCYEWDATQLRYRSLRGGIRPWANNQMFSVGDVVIADFAAFICEVEHTSSPSGTIYDEVGKWRNASNYGRVDVTNVSGNATVVVSEMNAGDFNIFVQPDDVTSSLVVTLPNPSQRTGQMLTYCFSAVPNISSTAIVSFNNSDGTTYPHTPSFKIPNAVGGHQGIRTLRFISTAKGNGDITAMWFPLDENFRGATDLVAGSGGYVPAPAISDRQKFLSGSGTWSSVVATLPTWLPNTTFDPGYVFLVGKSMFIATSATVSGSGSFDADLANGKPYTWVGGHEYVYSLPSTPGLINVDVPTVVIIPGTGAGTFLLPIPTGSGRRIRIIRDDTSATVLYVQDPATSQLYPIHHTAMREADMIVADTSVNGWLVDSYGSAQPRAFISTTITVSTTATVFQKNALLRVDTSAGAIDLILPTTGMSAGDTFQLIDAAGTWGINNLTVLSKIYGANDNYVIDLPKRKVTFVYVDSITGYILE